MAHTLCILKRNINTLACEAYGLYSSYFDRKISTIWLMRLMAHAINIPTRNTNNSACEAHSLGSLYFIMKFQTVWLVRPMAHIPHILLRKISKVCTQLSPHLSGITLKGWVDSKGGGSISTGVINPEGLNQF